MAQLLKGTRVRSYVVLLTGVALILSFFVHARIVSAAATLTVTTIADTIAADGACSLREAIQAANTNTTVNECIHDGSTGTDTIAFSIGAGGKQTIAVTSALPIITGPVVINGTTQPGFQDAPLIELNGISAGVGTPGLRITGGASTVRGLVINRFSGVGVELKSANNVVAGNYIGTDSNGTVRRGNGGQGVLIEGHDNIIGGTAANDRNIISANGGRGIHINGLNADRNVVQGNYVGLTADGTTGLGNSFAGIRIDLGANNRIGGATADARNVIGNNGFWGVRISGANATNNVVEGNYIGTAANGTTALGNAPGGVLVEFGAANNRIGGSADNAGNLIMGNGGAGVVIAAGGGNSILRNSIVDNAGLGIDIGSNGVTANDPGDVDTGPNTLQNHPVVLSAVPGANSTTVKGRLSGKVSTSTPVSFRIELFSSPTCDRSGSGEGKTFLASTSVSAITDEQGNIAFQATVPLVLTDGHAVVATATDAVGNTSEFSKCTLVSGANDSWPNASELTLVAPNPQDPSNKQASRSQYIFQQDQSRWYKFKVSPGSKVVVKLKNLPANYDLVLYKDIAKAYTTLATEQDMVRLQAEFAADAFNADAYSRDAYSPWVESPWVESPWVESPDVYSANAYSPWVESPDTYAPWVESPWVESPWVESPDREAFSSAQIRTLLGVSGADATADEEIVANTWNNTGDFYVRVRGRDGAHNLTAPFQLEVTQLSGACGTLNTYSSSSTIAATGGGYKTIILTDVGRMVGTDAEKATMRTRLATFAQRPEVKGVLVDVGTSSRINQLNDQADDVHDCPTTKNLVADGIKEVIDEYRELNGSLEYVVIVGNDSVIPFYRHPDQSLLAPESDYIVPVEERTASQASLRLGYVLSQDRYGATLEVSLNSDMFPIPNLPVGRLVETPSEVTGMLDAYLRTSSGVVQAPASMLVTGYDFLTDASKNIQRELEKGTGKTSNTLIASASLPTTAPPCEIGTTSDQCLWTADHLKTKLLGSRHDLIFLAGHFSQAGALAADHQSRLTTAEVDQSTVDLQNALIFSAGCHSGYNTVDADRIGGITAEPDWAQVFARKGATFIGGTGYQYGDTDFVEYGERLYGEFTRQLRTGSGPMPIGKALVAAKQNYLANTVQMLGIHEKTVLQSTLFGLPMLSINMPYERIPADSDLPDITAPSPYAAGQNPGYELGLKRTDLTVTPSFNPSDNNAAPYLSGSDGVVANPLKPVLPLEMRNVAAASTVLRGVGFRGGNYTDVLVPSVQTGAPTTEIARDQTPFISDVFYPVQPWTVNYFDAVAQPGGVTRLAVMGAQHRSSTSGAPVDTRRVFNSLNLRLFYSSNVTTYPNGDTPGLAAPPAVSGITALANGTDVTFSANAVGDPSAGMQEVWVTYTATDGALAGKWQSLNLVQSPTDSTQWQATLSGVTEPRKLRYMVQAVNGVGLVTLKTNLGAFYTPSPAAPVTPSSIYALAASDSRINVTWFDSSDDESQFILQRSPDPSFSTVTSFSVAANVTQYSDTQLAPGTTYYYRIKAKNANGDSAFTMAAGATTSAVANTPPPPPPAPIASLPSTVLTIVSGPSSGTYQSQVTFRATLTTSNGTALANKTLSFVFGSQVYQAQTGVNGEAATPVLLVTERPGRMELKVSFAGTSDYEGAATSKTFTVTKRATNLALMSGPSDPHGSSPTTIVATLTDADGSPVGYKTVFFVASGSSGTYRTAATTDHAGRAALGIIPLPAGIYSVTASFGGTITLDDGTTLSVTDDLYANGTTPQPVSSEVVLTKYTGASVIHSGSPLELAASVTRTSGGTIGNLSDARVRYEIRDRAGVLVTTALASEAPTGSSPATIPGLPSGVYTIHTSIVGGGFATALPSVDFVAVHDGAVGFVSGGGWIASPAGAYRPDTTLIGRANFGFVSKYAPGAQVPTGTTQFQFNVANLNFHSKTYDWLVVSGARAQYKGSGAINGMGDYGFILTAVDGQITGSVGVDKFRMKIWNKQSGEIVYDNQPGETDSSDATTALGGGSIVIHK